MERTMSIEDKIRRAEEIYNRKRKNESKINTTRVRVDNTEDTTNRNINRKLKKMIIQILICMSIYLIFYYVINNNYIFSEDFRKKSQEILSYDISFNEVYKNLSNWLTTIQQKYKELILNLQNKNNSIEEQNGNTVENTKQEQTNEEQNNQDAENSIQIQENIGGIDINIDEDAAKNTEESSDDPDSTDSLSEEEQMKKDAEEIKQKISFIKPLNGVITSKFGWRDPTISTVSKYHTGLDIAANTGTEIISSTKGKVVIASSEGAYGNHLKIQVENVEIIYAHCSKLIAAEGQEISQGQKIAEVGSTGNSTGPHLHFEIRMDGRYVDPQMILDF